MIQKKISDVIYSPISGEWGDEGDGVKVLRTTNFTNEGKLNLNNVVSRNVDLKKIEKKKLRYGDTIIEKSGGSPSQPVGRVVYFDISDEEFICNNFTSILRIKNEEIDSKYFFWFLFYQHLAKNTLQFQNKTTGIINLQLSKYLEQTQIKELPLQTQKHIASILDKADALRQQNRQLLAYYDALLQSTFIEMFGDPVENPKGLRITKIRDLITEAKYGTSKPAEESGKFKYLRMNNLTYGGFWDFSSIKYINLEKAEIPKYVIRRGDIIFNRTNSKELVGKTAVYNFDEPVAIAGYLIRVRTNEKAVPEYIWGYLNSKHGKSTLRNMCKSIVGMANINAQELQDIDIFQADISHQIEFAKIVKQVEAQKEQAKSSLAESEVLFQGLLSTYFGNK